MSTPKYSTGDNVSGDIWVILLDIVYADSGEISYRTDAQYDLHALALTNKRLSRIALPYVYRAIFLSRPLQLDNFLETVNRKPYLAAYIRDINILSDVWRVVPGRPPTLRYREERPSVFRSPLAYSWLIMTIVSMVMREMKALVHVRSGFERLVAFVRTIAAQLRIVHLTLTDDVFDNPYRIRALSPFFSHASNVTVRCSPENFAALDRLQRGLSSARNMESFSLKYTEKGDLFGISTLIRGFPFSPHVPLTRLHIDWAYPSAQYASWLSELPRLEYLDIRVHDFLRTGPFAHGEAGITMFVGAVERIGPQLRTLALGIVDVSRPVLWDGFLPRMLQSCTALVELRLMGVSSTPELVRALPAPTLESLHLRGSVPARGVPWLCPEFFAELLALPTGGGAEEEGLKCIVIKHDYVDEAPRNEELQATFRERGVECEVSCISQSDLVLN